MSEAEALAQASTERPECHLKLFISAGEPNSVIAQDNLRQLQQSRFHCKIVVEIVNVLENYQAALDHRVLVTPCLVLHSPSPRVMIAGTLRDRTKVIAALRLIEQECSE